jgi:hypothetical protein
MKLPRRQFLHLAAGAAALPTISRVAWAQAYPSRPVRIIASAAAGTAMDDPAARGARSWDVLFWIDCVDRRRHEELRSLRTSAY